MNGKALVILTGSVGQDPEVKRFDGGSVKAQFSMATNEFTGKGDDKKKVTHWHTVIAWGKLAEIIEQYVKKGNPLYIEGRLTYREYEKDGVTRKVTEILADQMQMLGGGKKESEESTEAPAQQPKPQAQGAQPDYTQPQDGDGLPF